MPQQSRPSLGRTGTLNNNACVQRGVTKGYIAAIGSAVFVGLFTVLNKWLLTEAVPPLTAGAWTYTAAGLTLLPFVCIKALAAGMALAALAAISHQSLAVPWRVVPGIVASGALSLGLSLALFYWAMRHIGAGRTGLISATSALWGVIAAILLLHESLSTQILAGGLLMLAGLFAFAWETTRASAPLPQSSA